MLTDDVKALQKQVADQQDTIRDLEKRLTMAEAEVKGISGLKKAAYWVGALIVAGAIGFGFSVLTFVPH